MKTTTEMVLVDIDKLIPYVNNARTHSPEQILKLRSSLREFGFINPVIIDKENNIIAGHGRVIAAKAEGIREVPCVFVDYLTEAQKKAYIIADNRMALDAGWDENTLKIELEELENIGYDLNKTGFDKEEIAEIFDKDIDDIVEDDADLSIPEEPKSKLGEIYQLGSHRLMVGDSTSEEDAKLLMDGKVADLLYTDPPYNVNVSNSKGMTIENDNMADKEFKEFLHKVFNVASANLKEGGAFYIWHADSESINFRVECEENGLMVKQCLIWVKNGFNFGRQDYKWKHEPCLYGWKDGAGHYFIDEFNHPTVMDQTFNIDSLCKDELKAMLQDYINHDHNTIIYQDKPLANDLHPTMKPVKMCAGMIRNSSKPQELVLDLFGGSGSTLIACEQLGRVCYMMEHEPKYADVIIKRYEDFTGKKAVKIN